MVLTEDTVYFLASKKKIEFLQKVEGSENGTAVKLLVRDKVCLYDFSLLYSFSVIELVGAVQAWVCDLVEPAICSTAGC